MSDGEHGRPEAVAEVALFETLSDQDRTGCDDRLDDGRIGGLEPEVKRRLDAAREQLGKLVSVEGVSDAMPCSSSNACTIV